MFPKDITEAKYLAGLSVYRKKICSCDSKSQEKWDSKEAAVTTENCICSIERNKGRQIIFKLKKGRPNQRFQVYAQIQKIKAQLAETNRVGLFFVWGFFEVKIYTSGFWIKKFTCQIIHSIWIQYIDGKKTNILLCNIP